MSNQSDSNSALSTNSNLIRMIRLISIYICVVFFQVGLAGQSKTAFLHAAEESYLQSDFYSALVYYLEVYEYDTSQVDIIHAVAESARKAGVYKTSERFYEKIMDQDIELQNSDDPFWLAYVKHKQGKYEEARKLYSIYITEYAEDDLYLTRRAEKEIKSCEWAQTEIQNPRENIEIERMGDEINEVEYADFAPIIDGSDLIFTSLRYRNAPTKDKPEQLISKRLQIDQENFIEEIYKTLGNDDLFVGHTVTNDDKSIIYYTLCGYHSGYQIQCDLYSGSIESDGSIAGGYKLPSPVNQEGSTTTQPAYYSNQSSGEQRLYFVSDMAGGEGEMDIWYVDLASSDFSTLVNVKELNTADNEITPFYHAPTNTMYFSSDGYLGMGGYDVFKSNLEDADVEAPLHLGSPINSSYNDIYYVVNDSGNESYFSTNRYNNQYQNNETEPCCYDIYKASVKDVQIELNAKTYQIQNKDSLPYATVDLFDLITGDLLKNLTPFSGIDHVFELQSDREYQLIGRKKGYGSDTIRVSTYGVYKSQNISRNLFLNKELQPLEITVFDEFTFEPLTGSIIRLKNIDKPNEPDLVFNNAEQFTKADIDPFSTYEITVSKEGYEDQSFKIYAGKNDLAEEILRRKVYLKPVLFGIYLPTRLYFDNDRPNPRTASEDTDKTYTDVYEPYVERENVFVRQIQRSSAFSQDRDGEIRRLQEFFEQDVKGGYATFQKFLDAVHSELQKGFGFEILIKGFTSPLAQSDYNKKLGKRRVKSILNEIQNYDQNVFMSYINSGLLKLTDVSYGEDLAPAGVIDNPGRPAESIYSTDASKERRVEIIEVRRIFKNRN